MHFRYAKYSVFEQNSAQNQCFEAFPLAESLENNSILRNSVYFRHAKYSVFEQNSAQNNCISVTRVLEFCTMSCTTLSGKFSSKLLTWPALSCHYFTLTPLSPFYHHFITTPLSPFYHHFITILSPRNLITILSPFYHHYITILSPLYHHFITILSPLFFITILSPFYHHFQLMIN